MAKKSPTVEGTWSPLDVISVVRENIHEFGWDEVNELKDIVDERWGFLLDQAILRGVFPKEVTDGLGESRKEAEEAAG
jgi:hypothetical protein